MPRASQHWYLQVEDDTSVAERMIEHLDSSGYKPLIRRAKESFAAVLGGPLPDAPTPRDETPKLRGIGTATVKGQLAAGDIFRPSAGHGVLYVAFYRGGGLIESPRLQTGAIGDSATIDDFDNFFRLVKGSYPETSERAWLPFRVFSTKFIDLSKDAEVKFVPGGSVKVIELENSRVLEDVSVRSLAIRIKSSGGILEGDLGKGPKAENGDAEAALRRLDEANLLAREHVIICRKSSNLVNRVDDPEKIEQMSKMGVLCSCGAPIKSERIERFLRPTEGLVRLLDGSFWMTARLVEALAKHGVSRDRILLTVQQGTEELDAFVDVDGTYSSLN